MDQLDLTEFFQTKAQARDFINRLSSVEEKIYETNFNLERELMKQFGIQKKDKIISFLRTNNVNINSGSALKGLFTKIQEKTTALPVISLTIAIEPDEQMIKDLSDWVLLNIKKQILFDILIDPHLIGGSTITYGGKFVDFSIKPLFESVLKNELETKTSSANNKVDYTKYHATQLKGNQRITDAPTIN